MYTLLRNAQIRTMDAAMPRAEAAVWANDRFAYVGSEAGARLFLTGKSHAVVDAGGATVLPGLNDSHLHCLHTALQAQRVPLVSARSVEDIVHALRTELDGGTPYLIGEGWNQERFDAPRLPTRADLDRVSTEIPVLAVRACGHILAANGKALSLAGIASGDGILREGEQDAVWRLIPTPTVPEMIAGLTALQHTLFAKGITSVQSDDFGSMDHRDIAAFLTGMCHASDSGNLRLRYAEQALLGDLEGMRAFFAQSLHTVRGQHFHIACMKLLTDGSLGARTAWMRAPYADMPDARGVAMYDDETLSALVGLAAQHGMPTVIHAIGDAAAQQVLDTLAAHGGGLRGGIVHAQVMDGAQAVRCGELGLVVHAQPIFLEADVPILQARVGKALAETSYRWRTMLSAGAHVAFGTDCPVEPFDPWPNLYCAVTREGRHGGDVLHADEAFTLDQAIYAYTAAGAYASGEENEKGRIQPGMLADFIVLDTRLDDNTPAQLLRTGVAKTYVGGACVYTS